MGSKLWGNMVSSPALLWVFIHLRRGACPRLTSMVDGLCPGRPAAWSCPQRLAPPAGATVHCSPILTACPRVQRALPRAKHSPPLHNHKDHVEENLTTI